MGRRGGGCRARCVLALAQGLAGCRGLPALFPEVEGGCAEKLPCAPASSLPCEAGHVAVLPPMMLLMLLLMRGWIWPACPKRTTGGRVAVLSGKQREPVSHLREPSLL